MFTIFPINPETSFVALLGIFFSRNFHEIIEFLKIYLGKKMSEQDTSMNSIEHFWDGSTEMHPEEKFAKSLKQISSSWKNFITTDRKTLRKHTYFQELLSKKLLEN